MLLHWQGGDHTPLQITRNGNGQHRWKTDLETDQLIRDLARLMPDGDIASLLNRLGKRTVKGNAWTQARVCTFRNARQVRAYQPGERQERGEMTVQEVADALQVSPMTVHRLIRRKVLPAKQLCVGAPWIIHQDDLEHPALRQLLPPNRPLPPDPNQIAIDFQ